MIEFILAMAEKYPIVVTILFFVGALRAVFKPLHLVIDAYVNFTDDPSDNEKWEKVKGHKYYKAVAWFIDYITSVKLPGHK